MTIPEVVPSHQLKEKRPNGRLRVATINNDKVITQQQFKAECDVNNIIKKYSSTGQITHLAKKAGIYADVSTITDYETALQTVIDAEAAFGTLPALTRQRFQNNPAELLKFLQNPANKEEAIKLGLIDKPTTEKIQNELNEIKTPPVTEKTKTEKTSS